MAQDKKQGQGNRPQTGQYRCEACGQTFNSEAELKEHNRVMHPEKTGQPTSLRCGVLRKAPGFWLCYGSTTTVPCMFEW